MVVLAEMMDIDAGHISLASPLGRALSNGKVGDEISLRLRPRCAAFADYRPRHGASSRDPDRTVDGHRRWNFLPGSSWSSATACSSLPEDGDERTRVGLYLPGHRDRFQQVQTGLIVATGPGTPVADLTVSTTSPGRSGRHDTCGKGMQAKVGDHAIFFRKAAVEITFEEKRYLVVPQAAILVLIRDDLPI